MIVDKINAYLTGEGIAIEEAILDNVAALSRYAFSRQFGAQTQAPTRSLRLSAMGQCARKLAYGVFGFTPNGKEIDSRARMIFFQGDIVELAIMQLAKVAGCDIRHSGGDQITVVIEGVPGHPDGLLGTRGEPDRLVEVKSMSSFAFERFERGEIDSSYIYQCNAYMECLSVQECVFVALNKDSGVLGERIIKKDPVIVNNILDKIKLINASGLNFLPPREYGPDPKGFLPWQCLYCTWHKTCWPSSRKVLVGRSYKLKVE